jgi:two-component system CheB/CheR fusion protein
MNMNNSRPAARRILVVDDNRDAARTLALLLKVKGYESHECYSGEQALATAERLRPQAILLDISMPGLDGYQTCQLLRQQPWGSQLLVIALSGYGSEEDQRRSLEAGFDMHLVKPVDLMGLLEVLEMASNP